MGNPMARKAIVCQSAWSQLPGLFSPLFSTVRTEWSINEETVGATCISAETSLENKMDEFEMLKCIYLLPDCCHTIHSLFPANNWYNHLWVCIDGVRWRSPWTRLPSSVQIYLIDWVYSWDVQCCCVVISEFSPLTMERKDWRRDVFGNVFVQVLLWKMQRTPLANRSHSSSFVAWLSQLAKFERL